MPDLYLAHWMLLCDAIATLLKASISKAEIQHAAQLLIEFTVEFKVLYKLENMSYNVHLCEHLAESVVNCGPLWGQSAFIYENYNGEILKTIRSSNNVMKQICERFLLKWAIPQLIKKYNHVFSEHEQHLLASLTSSKKLAKCSVIH